MRRVILYSVVVVAAVAVALLALDKTSLLVPISESGTAAMAPSIPACNGRALAEGFTYRFRDPRHGDIVAFHAAGELKGKVVPDAKSRDLALARRVIGAPGDTVEARGGAVYVNGFKVDDIETPGFPKTTVGAGQYFVLGDNRTASQDSRTFGTVPRSAIFGRVVLVFWPLGDFGSPESQHAGTPPGLVC